MVVLVGAVAGGDGDAVRGFIAGDSFGVASDQDDLDAAPGVGQVGEEAMASEGGWGLDFRGVGR